MQNWTNAKLCDVANLILGAFLFVSPWIFGFGAGLTSQKTSTTAMTVHVVIGLSLRRSLRSSSGSCPRARPVPRLAADRNAHARRPSGGGRTIS
jgi:SPW repeat-containing protein